MTPGHQSGYPFVADAKHVAVLHDVLEDGEGWESDCAELLDDDEFYALQLLTRVPDEGYTRYIATMADRMGRPFRIAREVKLADLRDNLSRIPPRQRRSYNAVAVAAWERKWLSLSRRYERAIATLEAA